MLRAASEQSGNTTAYCKGICLNVKARIWPRLSCVCHIRSTVLRHGTLHPEPKP